MTPPITPADRERLGKWYRFESRFAGRSSWSFGGYRLPAHPGAGLPAEVSCVFTGPDHPQHPGRWLAILDCIERYPGLEDLRGAVEECRKHSAECPPIERWSASEGFSDEIPRPHKSEETIGPGMVLKRTRWVAS